MLLSAAEEVTGRDIAGPVIVILFLTGAVIFVFGYAMAVMHRANRDYKTTKAALPGMRKTFWLTWWTAVKRGTFIVLIAVCLIFYWIRGDNKDADATTPQPTPSPTVSHRR